MEPIHGFSSHSWAIPLVGRPLLRLCLVPITKGWNGKKLYQASSYRHTVCFMQMSQCFLLKHLADIASKVQDFQIHVQLPCVPVYSYLRVL